MKVLITGANGFIGKNLQLHLAERKDVQVVCFTRADDLARLPTLLQGVDFVFHLAGINRPQDPAEFVSGNVGLTQALCQAVGAVAVRHGQKGAGGLHLIHPGRPRQRLWHQQNGR
jgi:UDP-2-acetamido-2,6-beta-L-arabino-hexul-4-ose reductase